MRGGRIAMEIETACWFQNPPDFRKANCHVDKIRQHFSLTEYLFKAENCIDQPPCILRFFTEHVELQFRLLSPVPSIDEHLRLGYVVFTDIIVNLIIVPIAVERRVDVAQIDGFLRDVLLKTSKLSP